MMTERPQPGDKIRVEGTVTKDGAYPGKMTLEDRVPFTDWKLEILERADSPERDGVGAWRMAPNGNLYQLRRANPLYTPMWFEILTGAAVGNHYVRDFQKVAVDVVVKNLKTLIEQRTPLARATDSEMAE